MGSTVSRARASEPVATTVQVQRDVQYGPAGERNLADVYVPADGRSDHPVLLLVHGGGFIRGDKSAMAALAQRYAQQGYVCMAINYRYAPGGRRVPLMRRDARMARNDVLRAVRWLRGHATDFGGNPARVLGLGASAGGTLVALASTEGSGNRTSNARLWASVSLSAPVELTRRGVAPAAYVDASDAPMLVVNATHELIPLANQRTLVRDLQRAGVAGTEPLTVDSTGHALELFDAVAPQVDGFLAHYANA